jgi:BCCT family betaine/carnitine transporter
MSITSQVPNTKTQVDWFIFGAGLFILVSISLTIVLAPQWSAAAIATANKFVTDELGIVYIIAAIAVLIFLLGIALSKHGDIILGNQNVPEHSMFSWASMLFCAGMGASLIYWAAAEWAFYYVAPPFGANASSTEAIKWASSYGIFHWGPVGWAFYCLPAVAMSCSDHIRGIPSLRLSSACIPVLGKWADLWPGRLVDLTFIVGLLGTAATGLGLGTTVVASAITKITPLEDGLTMQIVIIMIATAMICASVYRGLDKGIKLLSVINARMALLLLLFVFVAGPTAFILEVGVTAVGTVIQNFILMITWTDATQTGSFIEDWTIFYWAWWIALGPFVGMFVCRISSGRSLRQLILGMLGFGSLGCSLFFIVLGNYALFLELNGTYPVVSEAIDVGPSAAIASILSLLPYGSFWVAFVAVIGLVFIATTYDSASYSLAAGATRAMTDQQHPARWHRLFWACALGVLPIALLFLGGLQELQAASTLASVPLLFVYILLAVAIVRTLNEMKSQL